MPLFSGLCFRSSFVRVTSTHVPAPARGQALFLSGSGMRMALSCSGQLTLQKGRNREQMGWHVSGRGDVSASEVPLCAEFPPAAQGYCSVPSAELCSAVLFSLESSVNDSGQGTFAEHPQGPCMRLHPQTRPSDLRCPPPLPSAPTPMPSPVPQWPPRGAGLGLKPSAGSWPPE